MYELLIAFGNNAPLPSVFCLVGGIECSSPSFFLCTDPWLTLEVLWVWWTILIYNCSFFHTYWYGVFHIHVCILLCPWLLLTKLGYFLHAFVACEYHSPPEGSLSFLWIPTCIGGASCYSFICIHFTILLTKYSTPHLTLPIFSISREVAPSLWS